MDMIFVYHTGKNYFSSKDELHDFNLELFSLSQETKSISTKQNFYKLHINHTCKMGFLDHKEHIYHKYQDYIDEKKFAQYMHEKTYVYFFIEIDGYIISNLLYDDNYRVSTLSLLAENQQKTDSAQETEEKENTGFGQIDNQNLTLNVNGDILGPIIDLYFDGNKDDFVNKIMEAMMYIRKNHLKVLFYPDLLEVMENSQQNCSSYPFPFSWLKFVEMFVHHHMDEQQEDTVVCQISHNENKTEHYHIISVFE